MPRAPKAPITVNVISLSRTEKALQLATYFGKLVPKQSRTIGFPVAGVVKTIPERDQTVKEGEILAQLDVSELTQRRTDLETTIAGTQDPQQIAQAEQQISALDSQITARTIVAPFDCLIEEVFVSKNNLVAPQSRVLRVIEASGANIEIKLPSQIVPLIDTSQPVNFVLNNQLIAGKLSNHSQTEIAGSLDAKFAIETDLSNLDFRFGQTVEAQFNLSTENSGFWVPVSALDRSGEGLWSVLVVNTENGKNVVARKLASIVEIEDDAALIDGEFSSQQLVVANGLHRVVPGQVVNVNRLGAQDSVAAGAGE